MIRIQLPPGFNLRGVATSHGWYALAPYRWTEEESTLHRVEAAPSGAVTLLHIRQVGGYLQVEPEGGVQLGAPDLAELERRVRWCLRLDEDLSEFTSLSSADPELYRRVAPSGGRLLRCPTLWEDIVKTILTTNTTWRQTGAMSARLVALLGRELTTDPAARAFPEPAAVAAAGKTYLEEQVRLGYRSASVARIAKDVAEGRLDLESWVHSALPTQELRRRLLALPGVGPYAAATLLMILGRYDELAIDTELRAHVRRKYYRDTPPTESQIRDVYERWGRWRYLGYWFDPR